MLQLTSLSKRDSSASQSRKYFLIIFFLLTSMALASVLLSPRVGSAWAGRAEATVVGETAYPHPPERAQLTESYGKLPLRFEANHGQTSSEARFISRGNGYTLFLTPAGAVLRLQETGEKSFVDVFASSQTAQSASTLRMTLAHSNPAPIVAGVGELTGRSNYLIGKPSEWLTNVPNFAKVKYESVYPGIDLVYYGNQEGRLEYDFLVAPGANPRRIRLKFDGALSLRVDKDGDLVISIKDGEIRQEKPYVYQDTPRGTRKKVAARYHIRKSGEVVIELGAYDKKRALVIDPTLVYSTYLGGSGSDQGLGVAVGNDGSAYVVGTTGSTNFPTTSPLQGGKDALNDAFILKLNPAGSAFVYATYLGGNGDDSASTIAVDSTGHAYIAGWTNSGSFPRTAGAFQDAKEGGLDAFVAKLNPTGSALVYSTYLGGNATDQISAIALDAAGAAYIAGNTSSINFTMFPVERRRGNPVLKSTDAGANWSVSNNELTASIVNDFAVAPSDANVVYAATSLGIYKSADGGTSWQLTGTARTSTAPPSAKSVAVDPSNPNIVYAASQGGSGIYKSTDGGTLYEVKNNGIFIPSVNSLAIDPATPATVYAATFSGVFKSTNAGETWVEIDNGISDIFDFAPTVNEVVIDPTNTQIVYAATTSGVFKTTNGGANWILSSNGLNNGSSTSPALTLVIDPSNTSILYASVSAGFINGSVYKSTDGGANWTVSSNGLATMSGAESRALMVSALLVDPLSPTTIYAGTPGDGIFKSTDAGANWAMSNNGLTNRYVLALAARASGTTTILAGTSVGADAFVAKVAPSGSQLEYLRLLGGLESDTARGIAIDADGSAYVAGTTWSSDFPTMNAFQPALKGDGDAFVIKLNPTGSTFVYSTFLGGSDFDQSLGIAVGQAGEAYVTGTTYSDNFPLANALQPTRGDTSLSAEAFVTKIAADGQSLAYSTYLGGDRSDQSFGIAISPTGIASVTGLTSSTNFPVVNATPTAGGFTNAFVSRINSSGSALLFSTYFGGAGNNQGNAIAVDAQGSAFVVGNTNSRSFPLSNALRSTYGGGGNDAFIAKFGGAAELGVTITDSPDPVAFGSDLTYTVNVRNNGELPATGVILTDTLPEGATLVSATSTRGACSSSSGGAGGISCAIGHLNGADEAIITLVVKPPAVRNIINTATVTAEESDPLTTNNTATVETLVDFVQLSIVKKAAHNLVAPGARLTYTLHLKNNGIAAPSVTLTDNVPTGATSISCAATGGGVCGGAGNNVSVTFPSLAAGASEVITLTISVSASATEGTVIENTATVSSSLPDPDASDNSSTASVTITATPVLPKSNGLIAFASDGAFTPVSKPSGIYTVNPDGTDEKLFPNIPLKATHPAWSPDGARLAFQYRRYLNVNPYAINEINVINADGTGLLKVAQDASDSNGGITWSPGGAHIAFIGEGESFKPETARAIYIAHTDGTGTYRLPNSPTLLTSVDWSPDGSKFVYATNREIFIMNADASGQTKLTTIQQTDDGTTSDTDPQWSPDGTKILFTRSTTNTHNLHMMNSDGSGLTKLFNVLRTTQGTWSPDHTAVAFEAGNDIYSLSLDGTVQKLLTNNDYYDFSPDWQPLPNPDATPTPTPAPSYTLSGRVTLEDGRPFSSGQIEITGPIVATQYLDSNGVYSFIRLPAGEYTLTPVSAAYNFNPPSRVVVIGNADVTGVDFTATFVPANITGRITDENGNPLAGIKVTSSLGYPTGDTFTDANGFYSFLDVQRFRSYVIFPDPFTAYKFEPSQYNIPNLTGSHVLNFVGTKQPSNVIRGRVVEATPNGRGIGGVPVRLARDGHVAGVIFTDANGNFSFGERPSGHSYSVYVIDDNVYRYGPKSDSGSSSGGFDIDSLTTDQNLTIIATRRNVVQFAAAPSASEADGHVEALVMRSGDTSAAATVNYSTAPLTASPTSDYTTAVGTLHFAPGETTRSINVLLTDDAFVEGTESFTLTLDAPVGARLFGTRVVTVNITDNDTAPGGVNPVEDASFFVRQHYHDFLNREPDTSGLAFWINQIQECGTNAQCREIRRINASAAFFLSIEFQETGYLVYKTYKASFGNISNTPVPLRLDEFLPDTQMVSSGVIIGQAEAQALLEQNKAAYFDAFVERPRFITQYPLTMTPAQFVEALDQNTSSSLTQAEHDALVAELTTNNTTQGRAGVLRKVAENAEFTRRERNRAFVLMQYFGYLRRNPNDPPEPGLNFDGYNFWLNKLNEFGGNYIDAEMVKAFIISGEYKQRFGQ